jgi:hypothetical protein
LLRSASGVREDDWISCEFHAALQSGSGHTMWGDFQMANEAVNVYEKLC